MVSSLVKSIDTRSKCYKQLNELNSMKMAGVLSPDSPIYINLEILFPVNFFYCFVLVEQKS